MSTLALLGLVALIAAFGLLWSLWCEHTLSDIKLKLIKTKHQKRDEFADLFSDRHDWP